MLLQRTTHSKQDTPQPPAGTASDRPLTCMFFFFASQMKRNIQAADPDLVRRGIMPDRPTHQLDSMVARVGMFAVHSPLVTAFQTYPMEIPYAPGPARRTLPSGREQVHDTVLLIKFRDARAREEWMATEEWQRFMHDTDGQQVFRRMPHVRCASSVRGLMDPVDILTA